MTPTEKAIRDFCGHHADWWPSTTQVQEMLALAQPEQEPVPEKTWIYGTPLLDAMTQDCVPAQRPWQSLTDEDWEKVANRKNTVLDTFEQGATWAAYKLERRNT